jgi:hypothetical protein
LTLNNKGIMTKKESAYIFSSFDSEYTNPEKNKFTVRLNNPIDIPYNAIDCEIALHSATLWNSSPNIVDGHNKLYIIYEGKNYTLTFAQGLYSLDLLTTSVSTALAQAGLPTNLFTLSASSITQKITIHYSVINTQIDFTPDDTIRTFLGFSSRISPIGPVDILVKFDTADNVAHVNLVNFYYIVAENLVNNGISINDRSASILGAVPIISPPNSIINFISPSPVYICCTHLISKKLFDLTFHITNERLEPITMIEDWSFTILVNYTLPEYNSPPSY